MASPAEVEAEAVAVAEKQVMVVGIDDSEQSTYALGWTLKHFFTPYASNHPFKLVLVHAKPTVSSAVSLAGPGIKIKLPSFSCFFSSNTQQQKLFEMILYS